MPFDQVDDPPSVTFGEALDEFIELFAKDPGVSNDEIVEAFEARIPKYRTHMDIGAKKIVDETRLQAVDLHKGDSLVVECDAYLSMEQEENLRQHIQLTANDLELPVIVLQRGMRAGVLRKEVADDNA